MFSGTASLATPGESYRTRYLFFTLITSLIWVGLRLWHPAPWFPLDDAYITLHSAQVMHSGADPNFVGVHPLYGATSAPYLVLVYLLLFVLPPAAALSGACSLGALVYGLALLRMGVVFRMRPAAAALLVFLGLGSSYLPVQLFNGLETSWVLAAVAWSLILASEQRLSASALVAGMAAALRPEMMAFLLCMLVALATMAPSRKVLPRILLFGIVPLLPAALWYLHVSGSPIPQTGMAKRYFFAEDRQPWPDKLNTETTILLGFLRSIGLTAAGFLYLRRSPVAKGATAFVILLLVTSFIAVPGSLFWNYYRYLAPVVAIVVWSVGRMSQGQSRRSLLILAGCSLWCLAFLPSSVRIYLQSCRFTATQLNSAAIWCRDHLPANSVLLVHDAGYIAYATRFRMVDMVGLKTPGAIPLNRQYTWPSSGDDRVQAIAALASQTDATDLVMLRGWLNMGDIPGQLRALHWTVIPLRMDGAYMVFQIAPPQPNSATQLPISSPANR
jgi:hypothetical protein